MDVIYGRPLSGFPCISKVAMPRLKINSSVLGILMRPTFSAHALPAQMARRYVRVHVGWEVEEDDIKRERKLVRGKWSE